MKKKILIVGGTGFIGHALAKKCLTKKYDVISLSRNKPIVTRFLKKVKYLYVDITNKKELNKKINFKINYVVNCGGDIDHHGKNTYKSHFNGCKNLVDIISKKKIEKFIQIGSSVEYGEQVSPHFENNTKIRISKLKSKYAKAKLNSTNYLIKLYKLKKVPIIILRPYLIYGPNQSINRLIPFIITKCIEGKSFPCSHGNQLRDFIYIDDAINLILKCLKTKDIDGEIFNLCSGKPVKIKRIINLIEKKIGKGKALFGSLNLRKDEIMNFYGNSKKTQKLLKWKVQVNFNKGINNTIKFYENHFKKKY